MRMGGESQLGCCVASIILLLLLSIRRESSRLCNSGGLSIHANRRNAQGQLANRSIMYCIWQFIFCIFIEKSSALKAQLCQRTYCDGVKAEPRCRQVGSTLIGSSFLYPRPAAIIRYFPSYSGSTQLLPIDRTHPLPPELFNMGKILKSHKMIIPWWKQTLSTFAEVFDIQEEVELSPRVCQLSI